MIKIKSRKEYFELSRARRRTVLILMLGMFIILFAQTIKLAVFEKKGSIAEKVGSYRNNFGSN